MTILVKNRNVGISPFKIRKVCDLIRSRSAEEALKKLRFVDKKDIAITLTKLINSGLAIAAESNNQDLSSLMITKLMVDEGPTMKRFQPRAQGRAFKIRKRTSHITLELKAA